MAYIKEYWENRQERVVQARRHTEQMQKMYEGEITSSVQDTVVYGNRFEKRLHVVEMMGVYVWDMDTVGAAAELKDVGRVALLNFASYKTPGGMFLEGSVAQEECLCHKSFLYNVLSQFSDSYYLENRADKNRALYRNRSLYTPRVRFWYGDETFQCDVITCAAPNKSAAKRYCNVTDEENRRVLRSRIKHLLGVAETNYVDTLILGAWGCGVFGQDALEVAAMFYELLDKEYRSFGKVIFAIPGGRNGNLEAFREIFSKWKNEEE